MAIEIIKIMGAFLEQLDKQHSRSSPFTSKLGQIGSTVYLDFDFFSIAMGADYSFYVKSIATFALTFLGILFQS